MPTITYYQQARQDGGLRTGIEVDQNTVLERFDAAGDNVNPSLLWYVDVECKGKSLPADGPGAREWLIQHGKQIRLTLDQLADNIAVGIDAEAFPLQKTVPGIPRGIQVRITCSAVRRLDGRRISKFLRDISAHWEDRVMALEPIWN